MFFHVRITSTDPMRRSDDALALDKDEEWLEEHVLAPRRDGREIFIDGRVMSWDEIDQIHITETHLTSEALIPQIQAERASSGIAVPISDGWFVAVHGRDVTEMFISGPPGSAAVELRTEPSVTESDRKAVMVVYGQDTLANQALFDWLRAIGLEPREWSELTRASGSASPFIGQILHKAFEDAQAVVVLFTPDEHVVLRRELGEAPVQWRLQARPNVLFEAGLAFATHPDRTVLAVLGNHPLPSDLAGRHYVRIDGTSEALHELAARLEGAGCDVRRSGTQWLDGGRFPNRTEVPSEPTRGKPGTSADSSRSETRAPDEIERLLNAAVEVAADSLLDSVAPVTREAVTDWAATTEVTIRNCCGPSYSARFRVAGRNLPPRDELNTKIAFIHDDLTAKARGGFFT